MDTVQICSVDDGEIVWFHDVDGATFISCQINDNGDFISHEISFEDVLKIKEYLDNVTRD